MDVLPVHDHPAILHCPRRIWTALKYAVGTRPPAGTSGNMQSDLNTAWRLEIEPCELYINRWASLIVHHGARAWRVRQVRTAPARQCDVTVLREDSDKVLPNRAGEVLKARP
jgi:hypothetical protein